MARNDRLGSAIFIGLRPHHKLRTASSPQRFEQSRNRRKLRTEPDVSVRRGLNEICKPALLAAPVAESDPHNDFLDPLRALFYRAVHVYARSGNLP